MINIYKIAKYNTPLVLRKALRFTAIINVSVTYIQLIIARLFDFELNANLHAAMTSQVCYLEKMLQIYISPYAVINPISYQVVFWLEDEPEGEDVFISDSNNELLLSTEYEFGLSNFTVLLPASLSNNLINYAKLLLDKYKLPTTNYTILNTF